MYIVSMDFITNKNATFRCVIIMKKMRASGWKKVRLEEDNSATGQKFIFAGLNSERL